MGFNNKKNDANLYELNFNKGAKFIKLYDDIIEVLAEKLSPSGFRFAIRLSRYVSYNDCFLRENGCGDILSMNDISDLIGEDYKTVSRLMNELVNKGVLIKCHIEYLKTSKTMFGYICNPNIYAKDITVAESISSLFERFDWNNVRMIPCIKSQNTISKADIEKNNIYSSNTQNFKGLVYKLDFGDYGIYIGQTTIGLKNRLCSHKNSAKHGRNAYMLNKIYKENIDVFMKALETAEILYDSSSDNNTESNKPLDQIEYQFQVDALQNNKKLLGGQCWDDKFKLYMIHVVDINEYERLLALSFYYNRDPNRNSGYSSKIPQFYYQEKI